MNRDRLIRIAMAVCAVIVVVAVVFSVIGTFNGKPFGYAHAEKYTAGEAEISETVHNLDIEWINGKVNLEYHSGKAVELRETSDRAIGDDMKLRWWLDGDTLRIQYAKTGFRLAWNQEKELTVVLPEDISLHEVNIRATSGDLNVPGLKTDILNLEVTSGDIRAEAEAKKIFAGATSGSIAMKAAGESETVSAGTTSGSVRVEAGNVTVLQASSTSGNIQIEADLINRCNAGSTSGKVSVNLNEADQVEIGSTSGNISVKLMKFSALKAGSTSGKITAELPEQPGFTLRAETVSGSFDWNLALSRDGDHYVCGDGSAKAEFGTTSGNILLNRSDKEP